MKYIYFTLILFSNMCLASNDTNKVFTNINHLLSDESCSTPEVFIQNYNETSKIVYESLKNFSEDQAKKNSSQIQNLAKDFFPMLLPDGTPGIKSYQRCGIDLENLNQTLKDKNADQNKKLESFTNWKECIEMGYRNHIPKHTIKLINCYQKLIKN